MATLSNKSARSTASFFCKEKMKGYVGIGAKDFEAGYQQGHQSNAYVVTSLRIMADDVQRFSNAPDHAARLEGEVISDALGGTLPIEEGFFNLFVATDNPMRKLMKYRLFFSGSAGPMTLTGFKAITDDPRFSIWSNSAVLYTRILLGHVHENEDDGAEIHAAGLIFLYKIDFLKINALTFSIKGSPIARVRGLSQFSKFFMRTNWSFYKAKLRGRK